MERSTIAHIVNSLRLGTLTWSGRRECLDKARAQIDEGKVTKAGKKILKYYWKCAKCEQMFRDASDVEVDHIVEIGPFKGDWNEYISRMFCDVSNLQCLCVGCHLKKTTSAAHLKYRRKSL